MAWIYSCHQFHKQHQNKTKQKKQNKNQTLNNMWSIPSWISLKASRARLLASTWSIFAFKIFFNSLSTPGNPIDLDTLITFLLLFLFLCCTLALNSAPPQTLGFNLIYVPRNRIIGNRLWHTPLRKICIKTLKRTLAKVNRILKKNNFFFSFTFTSFYANANHSKDGTGKALGVWDAL